MNNRFKITLSILFLTVLASCNKEQDQKTSGTNTIFSVEILDSLVVDYIGAMAWSHISPDGQHFLALDQQKTDMLLIDRKGEIKIVINKTGDQPESIGPNLSGRPQFRNNEEIALLGSKGMFVFGFDGNLIKSIKPEFDPISNLIIQNADQFQFIDENNAVAVYGTRNPEGAGFFTEATGTKLEAIDVGQRTFTGILPYPTTSRFNTKETFPIANSIPVFRANKKGIYLAFKNDPKVYHYDWENLEIPKNEIKLKIEPFHLMDGKDPKAVDKEVIRFDVRDFAYGSINNIFISGDQIVLSYNQGLSDEEYQNITEGITDFQESFRVVGQNNKSVLAVFNEEGLPINIDVPDFLGRLEFVDQEGHLWFSPNKNEVERDYEVLFKTKLK
ncbi:hypothetical protein [Aquiflexum lacus]|uniref:hypothetical protein n=1 Tax=Aquiflexum lacus TaxID=2483805 RepID=UPI001894B715|nr:hypothetical protein [Aquiflexum lacus]